MKNRKLSFEFILSVIAIIIAAISAYVSYCAIAQSARIAYFQAFMALRSEFREILKTFPADYRKKGVRYEINSPEWNSIKRYWYHSFDEWAITNKFGHSELHDLWNRFYKDAICDALQKDSMRAVFNDLRQSEFKSPMEKDFVSEIESAYKNKFGTTPIE